MPSVSLSLSQGTDLICRYSPLTKQCEYYEEQAVCEFCKSKGFTTCLRTFGMKTELALVRSVPDAVEGVVKGEHINTLQYAYSPQFTLRCGAYLGSIVRMLV